MTKKQVYATLDRRIREVSAASSNAKQKGDDSTMYRLNTAFHWLNAVRQDIAELK